jgi:hypothetical protein
MQSGTQISKRKELYLCFSPEAKRKYELVKKESKKKYKRKLMPHVLVHFCQKKGTQGSLMGISYYNIPNSCTMGYS